MAFLDPEQFQCVNLLIVFNTRIIAVNHEVEWPPRSSYLTPSDFFLFGYLKSTVYFNFNSNTQCLMEKIFNEAQLLKEDQD